tara:strand:+ start:232 stop:861 length:630 start_codon:yes stop_codon:yes gene_type:complete
MIVEALETPKIYELDLQFTNEILSLNTVKSTYGFLPDRINMPATGYRLELISVDNIILYTYNFNFVTDVFISRPVECFNNDATFNSSKCSEFSTHQKLSDSQKILNVPYSEIGDKINIYDANNQIVLTIDVSEFSDYCGDSICSVKESSFNCLEDCASDEEIKELDSLYDNIKKKTNISHIFKTVLVIIFGFLIYKNRNILRILVSKFK